MKRRRSARFPRPSRDRPASANSRPPGKAAEMNKGAKMPQGSCAQRAVNEAHIRAAVALTR